MTPFSKFRMTASPASTFAAILATGAVWATMATQSEATRPTPLGLAEAAKVHGMGCKATTTPVPCSNIVSVTCAATPCTAGWVYWYCPAGSNEIVNKKANIFTCADIGTATGLTNCTTPVDAICATSQACSTGSSCVWAAGPPPPVAPGCAPPAGPINQTTSKVSAAYGAACPVQGSGPANTGASLSGTSAPRPSSNEILIARLNGVGFDPF